ncbi:MAG: hypothetical protein Q4C49_00045 [Bacillota bacterium]|nr:hypothetical protein [Bacillota bacterium]
MSYDNIRKKLGKYSKGGQIKKLQMGGNMSFQDTQELDQIRERMERFGGFNGLTTEDKSRYMELIELESMDMEDNASQAQIDTSLPDIQKQTQAMVDQQNQDQKTSDANSLVADEMSRLNKETSKNAKLTGVANAFGVNSDYIGDGKGQMNAAGAAATGIIAHAGVGAMKAVDQLAMGDKNFGAQSAAIDQAVHGVSGALMSSGNPYAMAAGAALEGVNFLTKAGGQTVQGFDIDVNSSGYGNIGHMESSSSRDFGAMIGLGGLNRAKMQRKLQNRNEQAQMALKAANIADTTKFEQEARMNSVDEVLRANSIALAGGIDTNVLGS